MVVLTITKTERQGPCQKRPSCTFVPLLALLLLFVSCFHKKLEDRATLPFIDSSAGKQQSYGSDLPVKSFVPDSGKKKIYITFDDGPNKGTRNVLKAVQEDSIPASFFIVGKHVYDSPEQTATWQLLQADSSILLCNHSYSHARNRYAKYYRYPDGVVKDFKRNHEKPGFTNTVVRMPGRNAWRTGLLHFTDLAASQRAIDAVQQAGFDVLGWDLEWMVDHKTLALVTDTGLLLRQIENLLSTGKTKTPGHLVLLAHDQAFQSRSAIEKLRYLFRQLKHNPEFELVPVLSYRGVQQ